jgi:hypothetical protein
MWSLHTLRCLAAVGIVLLALNRTAHAQNGGSPPVEHSNIQEGLPLELDDATPVERGVRQLHGFLRYMRTSERKDELVLVPRLNIGVAQDWEVLLSGKFLAGNADKKNSGDTRLDVLYNLLPETGLLPALAVSIQADFPTGRESRGIDTLLEFKASQPLGDAEARPTVHLNLGWSHNSAPRSGEHSDGYRLVLGYSRSATPNATLLFDVLSEQDLRQGQHQHFAEVGWRQQAGPRAAFTVGVSTGLGGDSPPFRITGGVQLAL